MSVAAYAAFPTTIKTIKLLFGRARPQRTGNKRARSRIGIESRRRRHHANWETLGCCRFAYSCDHNLVWGEHVAHTHTYTNRSFRSCRLHKFRISDGIEPAVLMVQTTDRPGHCCRRRRRPTTTMSRYCVRIFFRSLSENGPLKRSPD